MVVVWDMVLLDMSVGGIFSAPAETGVASCGCGCCCGGAGDERDLFEADTLIAGFVVPFMKAVGFGMPVPAAGADAAL